MSPCPCLPFVPLGLETSANTEVYQRTAQPLLLQVAKGKGAVALLLRYGQTGSGKTFTMSAIEVLPAPPHHRGPHLSALSGLTGGGMP